MWYSERTEHPTLRSLHTSFASSTVTNLFVNKYLLGGPYTFYMTMKHEYQTINDTGGTSIVDSLMLYFRRSAEVSPSLTAHFSFINLFYHSFITPLFNLLKPTEHVVLHSHRDILAPAILCTSSLWIRSADLT